jgi:hypothetical protein
VVSEILTGVYDLFSRPLVLFPLIIILSVFSRQIALWRHGRAEYNAVSKHMSAMRKVRLKEVWTARHFPNRAARRAAAREARQRLVEEMRASKEQEARSASDEQDAPTTNVDRPSP